MRPAIWMLVLGLAIAVLQVAARGDESSKHFRSVEDDGLIAYDIEDGRSIPRSLTGSAGSPEQGRTIVITRSLGNCLSCHRVPIAGQQDPGTIGTDLAGVGTRWSEGELRLRIVNPKVLDARTVMPAFYRSDGLHRVARSLVGKPILSAQQVEDVVAFLETLK